jgi:hypothetical protein
MPTAPHTAAQHHYETAERTRTTLGALGAMPEDATREATVAPVDALLSIAASVLAVDGGGQHAAVSE